MDVSWGVNASCNPTGDKPVKAAKWMDVAICNQRPSSVGDVDFFLVIFLTPVIL